MNVDIQVIIMPKKFTDKKNKVIISIDQVNKKIPDKSSKTIRGITIIEILL